MLVFATEFCILLESKSNDASHIILALLRTRNNKWHSSYTVSCIFAQTKPCRTVARCRSNHLCSASSRSLMLFPRVTSDGPHSENSKTDLTWVSETALSVFRSERRSGVGFSFGNRCINAVVAQRHRDPYFTLSVFWVISPNL